MKPRVKKFFLDGVDWQHELGEAMGGTRVYGSVEDLKAHNKCWDSCGIVEVEITLKRWVKKQDLFKEFRKKKKK